MVVSAATGVLQPTNALSCHPLFPFKPSLKSRKREINSKKQQGSYWPDSKGFEKLQPDLTSPYDLFSPRLFSTILDSALLVVSKTEVVVIHHRRRILPFIGAYHQLPAKVSSFPRSIMIADTTHW